MTRTIQDPELQLWEVYANSGDHGFPERAKVIFQCLTDPSRRARLVVRGGSKSDVETELATSTDQELLALFAEAEDLK